MSREPETETINVTIINETPKAYLLRNVDSDPLGDNDAWFPKSQIHFSHRKGEDAMAVIPTWLLEQKKGW